MRAHGAAITAAAVLFVDIRIRWSNGTVSFVLHSCSIFSFFRLFFLQYKVALVLTDNGVRVKVIIRKSEHLWSSENTLTIAYNLVKTRLLIVNKQKNLTNHKVQVWGMSKFSWFSFSLHILTLTILFSTDCKQVSWVISGVRKEWKL